MNLPLPVFWKHATTVLTGTVVAQALPLLVAPLITRLCTPADLGEFSVWLGVIAIASTIGTLRLEAAMILDHDSDEQQTCFSVVAYCSTLLAIFITFAVILARLTDLPQAQNMSWFGLMTIGVGAWLTAYNQAMLAYATSYRAFGKAAMAKICGAGTVALGQLVLLLVGVGGRALLAGQIIGLSIGLAAAMFLLSPPRPRISLLPTRSQLNYLKKHESFWRFSLPAGLLNTAAGKFPLFLVGAKYGLFAAGLFALTERILTAPVSLLAASVLEVFKRQSVHEFQTYGHCRQAFQSTFKALVLLGCGPALFIFAFAPNLCAWIFGEPWREAGEFARILAPLYFLNFVASPLSYVFFVAGKQKIELLWQIALFVTTITIFIAPVPLKQVLMHYTIAYSTLYLIYLFLSYRFSKNSSIGSGRLTDSGAANGG
ncbi:oligosaccharide flippase family protein [Massilia sp. ST3]|uniref:oligosaccharide flippase family protein n=1 Tax=Massilia sp. ST3 TaxID=2824903 RepID=UPI001B820370|nr:oligosaccharide flippase family protein [Massilia sp. ST3]MBQ5946919.1 oligosaccharide flippase family protein [Massilia sp. ST3]